MYPEGYSSSTSVPVGPAVSLTVHGSFVRYPPTPPRRAVPTVARTGLATTAFTTSATRSHASSSCSCSRARSWARFVRKTGRTTSAGRTRVCVAFCARATFLRAIFAPRRPVERRPEAGEERDPERDHRREGSCLPICNDAGDGHARQRAEEGRPARHGGVDQAVPVRMSVI